MKKNKQCTKCVLDTTVEDITFDENGVCNYCKEYDKVIKTIPTGVDAQNKLNQIAKEIKRDGKNKNYDCILGLSGGVDSTYLAHLVVELGLRPLVVHIDTGWNSEIAVQNIENVVKILNLDLFTYVVDWEEMKDLQLAFFRASVPDCDIPQDHVFPALLHKIAKENKLKHIISGHNVVTEYILPRNWSYDSNDLTHILDIHKRFGTIPLKKYPRYSLFDRMIYYRWIFHIKSHRFLNYIPYNKDKVKIFIQEKLAWRDYGGKHFESRFTKFFQSYYLPAKFGFDKRKAHLSNLIISGQLSKEEAIKELEKDLYDLNELEYDVEFVCKKLAISREEWNKIMSLPIKKHSEYKSDYNQVWYIAYRGIVTFVKRIINR